MDFFDDDFADMSELVDAAIDRVDLVGKAANGHRFILAKSGEANLFPADLVRDLITKENTMSAKLAKEDLDASTILAEVADVVDGDPTIPGSPAWEAVDAATAAKWTAILVRAKNAICELKEREKAEVDAGMEWDEDDVDDLKDVEAAVEYAISLLAPFAADEAGEAAWESMYAIQKSVKGIKARALATLEGFAPLVKAGRTLSAENETSLRAAADSIRKVLDSLPKAPVSQVADESNLGSETDGAAPAEITKDRVAEIIEDAIAKADEPAEDAPADDMVEEMPADDAEATDETMKEDSMMKATPDMSVMSDDELARVAITGADADRQAALQEIGLRTLTGGMDDADETPEEEAAEEAAELDSEDGEITEPAPSDTELAPASEVGTPTSLTKAIKTSEKKNKKVAKVIKAAHDNEERLVAVIKGLEDRIAHLEAPAMSKVLTNGALPPAHLMRGQDAGVSAMSDATALRKERDNADTAVVKAEIEERMRIASLEALAAMNNR